MINENVIAKKIVKLLKSNKYKITITGGERYLFGDFTFDRNSVKYKNEYIIQYRNVIDDLYALIQKQYKTQSHLEHLANTQLLFKEILEL